MPPLPSSLQDETTSLINLLTRRQKDLKEFQIPRLRDFKGLLSAQQQYGAEIRDDLEIFTRDVQTLESLAEDQERERERREVAHRARQFTEALEQMRKDTRIALLTSKRAIDSMAQSNREELLRSTVMSEKSSDEKSGDALTNASNDVTDALRRTIGLMQGELERSVLSSQMLEQSSANLRSATNVHDTLSGLLSTSKQLITALEKSDWLDRLLIMAAVAFFFLVVLFILKQRVVDKGIQIAFWWTRFLPDFSGDAELLNVESYGTVSGTVSVTTIAVTTTVFSASSFVGTTLTARTPEPSDVPENLLSNFVPSSSVHLTPDVQGIDDRIQELTSLASPPSETHEPRQHQEL